MGKGENKAAIATSSACVWNGFFIRRHANVINTFSKAIDETQNREEEKKIKEE